MSDAELRLKVDEAFLASLQERLGLPRGTDVARSALTLLEWAANEAARGRVILSTTEAGKDVHRLVMPELTTAAQKK